MHFKTSRQIIINNNLKNNKVFVLLLCFVLFLMFSRPVCQTVDYARCTGPWVCCGTFLTSSHITDTRFVPQVAHLGVVAVLVMRLKKQKHYLSFT
jgi:hypothetical protein